MQFHQGAKHYYRGVLVRLIDTLKESVYLTPEAKAGAEDGLIIPTIKSSVYSSLFEFLNRFSIRNVTANPAQVFLRNLAVSKKMAIGPDLVPVSLREPDGLTVNQ